MTDVQHVVQGAGGQACRVRSHPRSLLESVLLTFTRSQIAFLKMYSTRSAQQTAEDAVQIFGGRGITKTGMGRFIEHYHRTVPFDALLGGGTCSVILKERVVPDINLQLRMSLVTSVSARLFVRCRRYVALMGRSGTMLTVATERTSVRSWLRSPWVHLHFFSLHSFQIMRVLGISILYYG
jgi:hypothetical protein